MIIGLLGFKGSGKTIAAKHLEKKHGFVSINMKDALIAEMKQNFPQLMEEIIKLLPYNGLNPWTVERLFKEKPPVFRALMQEYGTEVRRNDDEWYWTLKWARLASECEKHVVVDDIRFQNEATCIRNAGGKLVRIERSDIKDGGTHVSEVEGQEIAADDTIGIAKGEFDYLYSTLDKILDIMGKVEKENENSI